MSNYRFQPTLRTARLKLTFGRSGVDASKIMDEKLLVVEAARIFDAEAAAIVGVFARHGCPWMVLSNDPAWSNPGWPTADSIGAAVDHFEPTIVHFALHGVEQGLLLRVSEGEDGQASESGDVNYILAWEAIERMPAWRGRVVITGACGMFRHAQAFLRAGARAVVAPGETIGWGDLCHFFRLLYSSLLGGERLGSALAATKSYAGAHYEGFQSFQVAGDSSWGRTNRCS